MAVSLAPMLPTPGPLPTAPGWGFEFKWDGMRVLVTVADSRVRVTSRSRGDYSTAFPELADLAELGHDAVLDGEIVALDENARPRFALAAKRFTTHPSRQLVAAVPVTFLAFDLLCLDGTDTTAQPYRHRRALLERVGLAGPHWQVPAGHDDGPAMLAAALDTGLEGIIAKNLNSAYTPGRSPDWIKIKPVDTADVVIGGWRGTPTHLRSLLVGQPTPDGNLTYRGRVASGLSDDDIHTLLRLLPTTDQCPFAPPPPREITIDAIWVEPVIVVEVAYAQLTAAGRMRHPRYLRTRPDKTPTDIDPPTGTGRQ